MKLYAHQQRFIERNPNRALLVWETGTGKTVAACVWRNHPVRKNYKALIVCPKGIVEKWKRDLNEWNANADVVSRDRVKSIDMQKYGVLILDEAHDFASPLFDTGRSQRTVTIYNYMRTHPDAHVLCLTATPIRSTPWNIHTLAIFVGHFWQVVPFKNKFFYLSNAFGRYHYEKKKHWQRLIRPNVEEIADVVLMSDCVDVPTQHHEVVNIPWTEEQESALKKGQTDVSREWVDRHRAEQGDAKFKELQKILDGYRKVIVVCHYLSQIEDYRARIGETREVYVLTGSTTNQDEVITGARQSDDCVFIIQASMGAGFDAAEFSVVVFASMSYKYIDWVQMKGRVKRINNLHENRLIHLLAGKCDRAVYNTIQEGRDFDVHDYLTRNKL